MASDGGLPPRRSANATHTPDERATLTTGDTPSDRGEGQEFVLAPPLAAPGIPVRNNASLEETAIPPTETEEQE